MCTPVLSRLRVRDPPLGAVQVTVGTWVAMCLMYSGGETNDERGRILERR